MGLLKGFELENQTGFEQLPAAEPVLPAPGIFETGAAVFRRNRAGVDWGLNQSRYENDAQAEIMGELRQRGYEVPNYSITAARLNRQRMARGDQPNALAMQSVNADDALWAAVAAERRRDPKFLSGYGDVRDLTSLTASMIRRRQRDVAAEEPTIARAGTGTRIAAELGGGIVAGMLDPTSYIPVGGGAKAGLSAGRQILDVGLKEAFANVAVTAATEPLVRDDAVRLGQERDIGDTLTDLAVAGGTGFVIGGGFKALDVALPEVRERAIAKLFDRLPEAVQRRMIEAGTLDQRVEAEAFHAAVPPDYRTVDERAAVSTVNADADVRESNPFVASPAGDMAHGQRLSAAVDALLSGEPIPGFVPPKRPSLRSSTALSSDNRDIAGRIIMAESGGNPKARNPVPGQTASGLGQFTDESWLSGVKRWFPSRARGRTDAELLALKTDPVFGRRMTERAVESYAQILNNAGYEANATNSYLMHFLGPRRAIDMLRAAPSLPIERFLPEAVIKANEKVLRGKTVGDVRAWAAERIGAEDGGAPEIRDVDSEDGLQLRPDQFDSAADRRAAETALYGSERGPFGPIYRDVAGDWNATVDRLMSAKNGEVPAALHHPEIGDIDVVWGNADMGLRHIIEKHGHELAGELVQRLPELIDRMKIARQTDQRISLQGDEARVGVRLDWDGREKRWLVTAFENDPSPTDVTRTGDGGRDGSPGLGSGGTIGGKGRARKRSRPNRPVDLLTQIARWGGLRDDEKNDFAGTAGLGGRMTSSGKVLRQGGLSVDRLGERLWEAGWFGPPNVADRPTLDEVIDLVEEAARGDKVYHPEERAAIAEQLRALDDGSDEIEQMIAAAADDLGVQVDPAVAAEAEARIRRGEEPDDALIGAINDRMFDEAAADATAAGGEMTDITPAMSDADWQKLDEARGSLDRFDDPEGQAAIEQAMSIEHDLRMAMAAEPDERFVLDDSGERRSIAEILEEADREAAAAEAMRACMIPPKGASE